MKYKNWPEIRPSFTFFIRHSVTGRSEGCGDRPGADGESGADVTATAFLFEAPRPLFAVPSDSRINVIPIHVLNTLKNAMNWARASKPVEASM